MAEARVRTSAATGATGGAVVAGEDWHALPVQRDESPPLSPAGVDAAALARIGVAVGRSRSPATVRAYASDWAKFCTWCSTRGYTALPAEPVVLADYLTTMADTRDPAGERVVAVATLVRWVAAITAAHHTAGHAAPGESELVRVTVAGIRRMYADAGDRRPHRRAPLLLDDVRAILDTARTGARSSGCRRSPNAATPR